MCKSICHLSPRLDPSTRKSSDPPGLLRTGRHRYGVDGRWRSGPCLPMRSSEAVGFGTADMRRPVRSSNRSWSRRYPHRLRHYRPRFLHDETSTSISAQEGCSRWDVWTPHCVSLFGQFLRFILTDSFSAYPPLQSVRSWLIIATTTPTLKTVHGISWRRPSGHKS